ncbi:MAG: response regulator transcription factor [Limnochordales bacterium]|nr:response regulator transcription factor [Limnochordales bacterium]
MKILVVDDEPHIVELIAYHLQREGFGVITAADGAEALDKVEENRPDLVLLDVMLPGLDGFSVCQRIRRQQDVPIILLTAKTAEDDRVFGLEVGADDYITKPFGARELLARVKAVLRRARGFGRPGDAIRRGPLVIDGDRRRATLDGQPLALTLKEFDLLHLLASRPGRAFSREELLRDVWGYDYVGTTRTVDVHIQRLRHKLGDHPAQPRFIHTVHGIGYRFTDAW